jgi:hypothetical protein
MSTKARNAVGRYPHGGAAALAAVPHADLQQRSREAATSGLRELVSCPAVIFVRARAIGSALNALADRRRPAAEPATRDWAYMVDNEFNPTMSKHEGPGVVGPSRCSLGGSGLTFHCRERASPSSRIRAGRGSGSRSEPLRRQALMSWHHLHYSMATHAWVFSERVRRLSLNSA